MEAHPGVEIVALPWAPGRSVCPSLGVADYRFSVAQRLSRTYRKGPFGATPRLPTVTELAALRDAVCAHLAAIDRGEVNV